jgi:molybdenum cofactor biosynthesis protein B
VTKKEQNFIPLNVAVLTISDSRVAENDTSGDLIDERLEQAGHQIVNRRILREDVEELCAAFHTLVDDPVWMLSFLPAVRV